MTDGERPALADRCPRCGVLVLPAAREQSCPGCKKRITLALGKASEPKLALPEAGAQLVAKSAGLMHREKHVVGPQGISSGQLDVAIGLVQTNERGIGYDHIHSLATWKSVDWALFGLTTLVPVPISALFLAIAFPEGLLGAIPFALISAFGYWRSISVGKRRMRVVGENVILSLRYDQPWWRHRKFRLEAFRRAGIELVEKP